MPASPRSKLREFYHQALVSPDFLCLNCSYSIWNHAGGECSPSQRQQCRLFAEEMHNELAAGLGEGVITSRLDIGVEL